MVASKFNPGRYCVCVGMLLVLAAVSAAQQQFAELGNFKLESGEAIRDCRIGYRTLGRLNADKSNVIVFPTWASGTSEQAQSNIGPGRLVDSTKYYVVIVDALSNGISSSPSNSSAQPRMIFPRISIRDIVNSQHELLTTVLHFHHVKAIVGVSMGGMQAFQWMVAYPDFMDRVVPVVGSPQLAAYDLISWQAQVDAIMNDTGWNKGNYTVNPARSAEAEFGKLLLTTPDYVNQHTQRKEALADIEQTKKTSLFDANDKIRQAQAMMALDVAAPFGGSLQHAAAVVKAKVFIVVAKSDHVVTPGPAMAFARLLNAPVLELTGDCGHLAPSCEAATVNHAVAEFLDR
jgi:homoserine O-acetyltransferase